jgi:hypothetical protein
MLRYSDLIDRLFLRERLLEKLVPSEVIDPELVRRVREANASDIAGSQGIADEGAFSLVRGGLFYLLDALPSGNSWGSSGDVRVLDKGFS